MSKLKSALDAYGNSGLEYKIDTASPHQLVCLLFDGAAKALLIAKHALNDRRIAEKGQAISKAISIIEEGLRVSLDRTVGGELVDNLDALYEYMSRRLLEANLYNDGLILDEVYNLLLQLKTAWEQIAEKPANEVEVVEVSQTTARHSLSYGRV
ncbi:flagellar export chaperone FliS [Chitinimonas sp.]|uniref:flagellar export chaperone FliS n=1 Tax=Chitinimonas sp. TaxID=1934313 RepID=UPI0035AF5511